MEGHPTTAAAELLRTAVDGLLSAELGTLSGIEVMGLLEAIEVQRRRLEAVDQRLLAEAGERRLAGDYARSSVEELLVARLRVSPTEAKARVIRAQELGPRRALTGEPLQPILPVVADAVRAGEISAAHAAVISRCLDEIPGVIAAEACPVAEQLLVEAARHEHPRQLAKTTQLLLARIRTASDHGRTRSNASVRSPCASMRTGRPMRPVG